MATTSTQSNTFLKVILAILLPPLAVFMERGFGGQFLLNVVLTIVGLWLVGIIHALVLIL